MSATTKSGGSVPGAKSGVRLVVEDSEIPLTVICGTEGERGIDIARLRAQSGLVTLDSGYANTGACRSEITFLDGERGVLRYRGIPIEQLAEKSHFVEVAYLLVYGQLPSREQLANFSQGIERHSSIPDELAQLVGSLGERVHPMGVLSAATVALSGYFPQGVQPVLTPEQRGEVVVQLMGQMRAMIAACYRRGEGGQKSVPGESYCQGFLRMMFGASDRSLAPEVVRALDVLLLLHADHEQNCSTSTVRMVGSGRANVFAAIAAGINALWGPLHGGANEAVMNMLDAISAEGGDYKRFLARAKDRRDAFRLMGFGHRVYKNFDPRAQIIKRACDDVLEVLGVSDPALEVAKGLEEEALRDEYFVQRKLYPNVDFYSGIIYRALGIPRSFFTPLFVLGRLPGWLAQWEEMVGDSQMRICRPRQIYVGATNRPYVEMAKR